MNKKLSPDEAIDHQLMAYDYELPLRLIAQTPIYPRENAKLLIYKKKSDQIVHTHVSQLPEILSPKTRLIFNESKVFPCRVLSKKITGASVEIFFLENKFNEKGEVKALLKSARKKKVGESLILPHVEKELRIISEAGEHGVEFILFCKNSLFNLSEYLNKYGELPLPPYIKRTANNSDAVDYQNYFAKTTGSVAAPTAGLHFTDSLLKRLSTNDILLKYITLHVGLGTFLPVKSGDIRDHKMHYENFFIPEDVWQDFVAHPMQTILVGTTSLRSIQSKWEGLDHSTNLYLYPGRPVVPIKGLMTNFHLPKSTLLMLVSALIGREKVLEIYQKAIELDYRFFSYGDAMLILMDE
ncbi:MAG: tRNA preQ1(34) S-adenosylmethionine ribosyltransferase-isomerase QueA [Bacteriovoracaceae bacterium]|nr:tRNA preQ1(34) S-adenosylmethionine ribosyltransferase-isomerase QueA [Bacteriovoracaceae bacterium]